MTTLYARRRFTVGESLSTRSLGDWDCIFRFTVVSRTAKFVTLRYYDKDLRVGIKESEGVEYCYPFGRHSMAPTLNAGETVTE